MLRAVLFDIGGVLEMTPSTRWQDRWERGLGLPSGAIDDRLQSIYRDGTVGAVSHDEIVRRIGEVVGVERVDQVLEDLWEEYLGEPNTKLIDYFAGLRPRYRTGILSNSWVGAREREQARYRFGDLCDVIVYSHEEGIVKPEPRFYEIACERLRVRPEDVVFLDDVRGHVEAARSLGMTALHFVDTNEALSELRRLLDGER